MHLIIAVRAFFATLFDGETARRVALALSGELPAAPVAPAPSPTAAPKPVASGRNDAVALLSALQRDARFIDLVREPLADYSDDQVGAAARDVLRQCREVLDRYFTIEAVVDGAEGSRLEVPRGFSPARFRLVGNVTGEGPYQGTLVHHGWRATRVELPKWTGDASSTNILVPAEVEL